MIQNRNDCFSAAKAELLLLKRFAAGLGFVAPLVCFLMGAALLRGQVTNVSVKATATQAVITYSAPDNGMCSMEVHESADITGPLVPDVDPSLFFGANFDTRSVNLVNGQRRIFVAGKRTAESALDGYRHSRALQNNTQHFFKITCGSSTATGQFQTMNPPLGMTYNDPLPADPQHPGQYAWPNFSWTNRSATSPNTLPLWVVDPLTGFRIRQLDTPRDAIDSTGTTTFASGSNLGGSTDWTNPNAATADDTAAATYSGSTRGYLFLELGVPIYSSGSHFFYASSPNSLVPTFNAYCSSSDCAGASSDDRSIQYCLTIDGLSCVSDVLEAVLVPCLSACTGGSYRFTPFPNPTPILADWYPSRNGIPNIDVTDLSKRSGVVTRNGASVTLVYGDHFNLNWAAGSQITINSVVYTIASVDSDAAITLSGSPAGTDASTAYSGSNAGILIRKKTTSPSQISIQSVTYAFEIGQQANVESTGDEDWFSNCSSVEVAGPGGEMGFHCVFSGTLYWIGENSGTVNRIGRGVTAGSGTDPNNSWNHQACQGGSYWDAVDVNSLYCLAATTVYHYNILKLTYKGSNNDIGDLGATQSNAPCNSNASNPPCWSEINLTPATLDAQFISFNHPAWAATNFHTNSVAVFGRMPITNSLLVMARRDQNNDTMSFVFRFDLNTNQIVAGVPTFANYPLRWAGSHGPYSLNDPTWVHISATNFRGPFTGKDYTAGSGPYYSTVTSGAIGTTGQPCPARPANSPIGASDWPTGNQCITLTVDGEPGDPTPNYITDGTISVSGTNVTGTGTNWTFFMDQTQMFIGGNYYKFTVVDANHGTLDRSAGTIANSPYTLYMEAVNNPKVGNPAFAYLQDTQVRDIFCAVGNGVFGCNPTNYAVNEFMRLIYKDPNNPNLWTLQRAYTASYPAQPMKPLSASAWLIAMPSSCYFSDGPCQESHVDWNPLLDTYGLNANGNTVNIDPNEKGCCHGTHQGVNVDLGTVTCPSVGPFHISSCYFTRYSTPPALYADKGFPVSMAPQFHGYQGEGGPLPVDTHPSHNQVSPPAPPNELRWIGDSRPMLGDPAMLGNGTNIGGSLYKFTASQTFLLHPRVMPTMASCGANPLLDVSGPSSSIATTPSDNYKYCIALGGGECVSGSSAGDLYVNCPQIKVPACPFQGIGNSDPETRDICVSDMGAQAMNMTQVGVDRPDVDGVYSRRVTAAFSHYRWLDEFWNLKVLPNGKWMVVWSAFFQNQRNSMLLVKLPPFPQSEPEDIRRNDFVPHTVKIGPPQIAGVTNVVVQFGYNPSYYCTSRNEPCVQGSAANFNYQSENPAGVPCTGPNGCSVTVQAISQRVMYYQVLLRDASNNVIGQMIPEAVALK